MARPWRVFLTLGLLGWTALVAALSPVRIAPVGAEPSLDLDPGRGRWWYLRVGR